MGGMDSFGMGGDTEANVVCYFGMWATNGKDWAEKRGFRDALERMMGMIELEAMLCIVGDFNVHVGAAEQGEEECFGKFGWEKRNREGRELMELVARNGMAIARSFFQKRESHNITDRSGHYRTELDLVVVRKRQLWRVKDCKGSGRRACYHPAQACGVCGVDGEKEEGLEQGSEVH